VNGALCFTIKNADISIVIVFCCSSLGLKVYSFIVYEAMLVGS